MHAITLPMQIRCSIVPEAMRWIKLTDFGTSHMEALKPAKGAIFTTIENVPIDLLLSRHSVHAHMLMIRSLLASRSSIFLAVVFHTSLMHYCTDDLREPCRGLVREQGSVII